MIVDIGNEILTKLKNDLSVEVVTSYQDGIDEYPRVVFTEGSITTHAESVDTSGETRNNQAFEINIFTIGSTKMSDAKTIRAQVDVIMSDFYNMNRNFSDSVPNYGDDRIYRYILRYDCIVDANKNIYRG